MLSSWFHRSKKSSRLAQDNAEIKSLAAHPALNKQKIKHKVSQQLKEIEHQIYDKSHKTANLASNQVQLLEKKMYENPWKFVAGAAAFGLVLGLLISRK